MFPHVILTDTWVLSWEEQPGRLVFSIEASLWPGHPNYEPPSPANWTCYKRARLIFGGVGEVLGLCDLTSVHGNIDADGSVDFGSIDELVRLPGGYRIAGEFGNVRMQANSIRLEME